MTYARGRRAEWRTQKVLERAGYRTVRTAGSKGGFDVLAWLPGHPVTRFISVKAGTGRASPAEREQLALSVPEGSTAELWHWPDRAREPVITLLNASGGLDVD